MTNQTPPPSKRLRALRLRRRLIRRRVVAITAAVFVAVWATITIQLASGHDPALARKTAANGAPPANTTSSSTAAPTVTPAPVTTGQS